MARGRILVVAGSDSSGGAGLEADQRVITAHACYCMTATTGLTAQNTTGVSDIYKIPSDFVKKQIDCCLEDIGADVIKTGMLTRTETITVVANAIRSYRVPTVVVDPVMVSTSGAQLLPREAVQTLVKELLPLTTILTPNIPEATLLLEQCGLTTSEPRNLNDLIRIAKHLCSRGPKYILLKGGHFPLKKDRTAAEDRRDRSKVVDILCAADGTVTIFETEYITSKNTHGTGCSLASAIAANMANGMCVPRAIKAASRYIEAGIRTSEGLGKGNGPINHFHSLYNLPFAPGHFIEYLLDRPDVQVAWKAHVEHQFVQALADGTLPTDAFRYYLIQDYSFLIQFARANALAAYKAKSIEDIKTSAETVLHIHDETALHIEYCKSFGLSKEDVERSDESQGACTAYTRYVLDIGQSDDWFALQVAIAPCLIGYGTIARRLYDDPKTLRQGNPYWKWIESYVADDYSKAVRNGSDLLEKHAVLQSPSRIEELVKIFIHATKMEMGFWDMGIGKTT